LEPFNFELILEIFLKLFNLVFKAGFVDFMEDLSDLWERVTIFRHVFAVVQWVFNQ